MKSLFAALACLLGATAGVCAAPKHPTTGTLSIIAAPEESAVFINRVLRGSAPLTAELEADDYLVTIDRAGYRPEHRSVTVTAGVRQTVRVELAALTGLLLVHSSPSGAEVTINGVDHGRTPALITTLPLGVYRVKLDLPGYRAKEIEAALTDRVPHHITVDLTSDSATLNITSAIPDAEVLVNGVIRGTAPCTVDRIPAGEIVVEVRAPGYVTFTQIMRLAEGEIHTLPVRMDEQPASLNVVSIPDRARVYVNNDFKGETPLTLAKLIPGEHRVRVELPGFEASARTLTLARGDSKTEEFRLTGNTGRLLVTTEPDGVTLLINGEPRGKTLAAQGEGIRASAPFAVDFIPEGTYAVKFVRQGYFEQTEDLVVQRGQTQTMHIKLVRRFIPNYEVTTAGGTYRGIFESKTDESIRMEIAPGVISTYLIKDIRKHRPLPDTIDP